MPVRYFEALIGGQTLHRSFARTEMCRKFSLGVGTIRRLALPPGPPV